MASHFSAGAVDLDGHRHQEDGKLDFTGKTDGVLREPDAREVDRRRPFRRRQRRRLRRRLARLHHLQARTGRWSSNRRKPGARDCRDRAITRTTATRRAWNWNWSRSPRSTACRMLFVASERASLVAVYDLTDPAAPVLKQMLPSGISPEGMVAIPSREPVGHRERGRPARRRPGPGACDDLRAGRGRCGLSDDHQRRAAIR